VNEIPPASRSVASPAVPMQMENRRVFKLIAIVCVAVVEQRNWQLLERAAVSRLTTGKSSLDMSKKYRVVDRVSFKLIRIQTCRSIIPHQLEIQLPEGRTLVTTIGITVKN